jgi:hypothetical protein
MEDQRSLTPEAAIQIGGWNGSYATVVKIETRADGAFAAMDTNGDGREIEETYYLWDGNHWEELGSNGWGTSLRAGWAHGYAPGQRMVTLSYARRHHTVPVDDDGEWWFVGRRQRDSGDDIPDIPEIVTDP